MSIEPELKRTLGLTSAIAVIVGGVIGSGIFLKPLDIAKNLPDPIWIHSTWVALGVVCLFGAFAYAELGAMLPEAGGQYAFLREGWGRFVAFLYGWCLFLVINTGTLAALAVAFATAVLTVAGGGGEAASVSIASAMILALALVNHFGARHGAAFQNVSTFAKLLALAAIVVAAVAAGGGGGGARPAAADVAARAANPDLVAGLVSASIAIFWAYEGWYQLPFNAAELKRPERDLPLGLILGVGILIVVYIAVNAAYLHVVPIGEMRGLENDIDVPRLAVERIFGTAAGSALALLIALSVIGAANPGLLSTPRAFYAMAKDGLLFPSLARVHPRWHTPTVAIWVQAVWSVALVVVLKTFRDITEFVIFAALLFYALAVAAVYVLRRKMPDRPRPYRCFGYPVTPALFIAVVLFVDAKTLEDPLSRWNALYGLAIIAAGAVAYVMFVRGRSARVSSSS